MRQRAIAKKTGAVLQNAADQPRKNRFLGGQNLRSKGNFIFFYFFFTVITIVSSPAFSKGEKSKHTDQSSSSHSLIGTVHLDPGVSAITYKVKIKQSEQVIFTDRIPAEKPFRFDQILPGKYDLVIEARGHSTFVAPGFIKIGSEEITKINVTVSKAKTVFLKKDATGIIMCSACHKGVYREMFRGEFHTGPWPDAEGKLIQLPDLQRDFYANSTPMHLSYVSPITVAAIAEQPESKREACQSCHAPSHILTTTGESPHRPKRRKENRIDGVTCASCHMDSDGSIHGKHDVSSPHPTVQDPLFTRARSAELCAACHQADEMAPAFQTFAEWQTDFSPKDSRTCQSCHMPPTVRLLSNIFTDRPKRSIGKHIFAGGHSLPMLKKAATLSIEQDDVDPGQLHIGVTNSGAGHSLPTGYGRRAVILRVAFVGPGDEGRPETLAIYAVDPGLGPVSEQLYPAIRAGVSEKISIKLGERSGLYQVKAELFYDLDRLNDFNDETLPLIASTEIQLEVK